jgi:TPR repeat protein
LAFKEFNKACEKGVGEACYFVGESYQYGKGIKVNMDKAVEAYEKSCKLKYPKGCTYLGSLYFYGDDVEQDFDQARKFFQIGVIWGIVTGV